MDEPTSCETKGVVFGFASQDVFCMKRSLPREGTIRDGGEELGGEVGESK